MILNNLPQQFVIYFDSNTFYPMVNETWLPVIKRMMLPYLSLEDFFNSQIQSLSFPGFNGSPVSQQMGLYNVKKRPGRAADQIQEKNLSLTVKLTESYISYFVARQQYDEFLALGPARDVKELYMPSIFLSFLDDAGFETITYQMDELTPTGISDLSLSYAARIGSFNTFTWNFSYNYLSIWYRKPDGTRVLLNNDILIDKMNYENNINNVLRNYSKLEQKRMMVGG